MSTRTAPAKTERVVVRMTQGERDAMTRAARKSKLDLSTWIRTVAALEALRVGK